MVELEFTRLIQEKDYIYEVVKILLDTKNLGSSQSDRSVLISQLFAYLSTAEVSQNSRNTLMNILPILMWLYFCLPMPTVTNSLQASLAQLSPEQKEFLNRLEELIELLEATLVGCYQYTSTCQPQVEKALPIRTVQQILSKPNIYAQKAVYSPKEKPINPNLASITVGHYLSQTQMDIDESIESFTPSTKPVIVEALLQFFNNYLSESVSSESLLIMILFLERILCTDFVNTPVPYAPEIPEIVLKTFPEPIIQFYKSFVFIWSQICDSFQPLASPMSPLPSAKIPYRFSISSTTTSSRKHSIPDPLRPSTAASNMSHAVNSTIPASRLLNPVVPPSPIRTTLKSTLPLDIQPRLTLSRQTLRFALSILAFCHSHKTELDERWSKSSIPEIREYSGFWDLICPNQKVVLVDVHGNTLDDKSSRSRANSDVKFATGKARKSVEPHVSNFQEAFKYMVKKCTKTLYYRATNELLFEIAMGARCLLNEK